MNHEFNKTQFSKNFSQVFLAADHAGFNLKAKLIAWLAPFGIRITNLGVDTENSVDYPDMAYDLCRQLMKGAAGILICGSGIGMSIAANRYTHIRAALCHEPLSAYLARAHNNANVLCLGSRLVGETMAKECVTAFLCTVFEEGRHQRRVEKLTTCSMP